MAYVSGTASDYSDLLDRLVTFLTTNTQLTSQSPSQAWTVLRDVTPPFVQGGVPRQGEREVQFKAPGMSNADEFYMHIVKYSNSGSDIYNWMIGASVGFQSTKDYANQAGVIGAWYNMCLWNQSIPYWFFASGRRCIVVAKVGTVYESIYMGAWLPYATPAQYPYPLCVIGTNRDKNRFSDQQNRHRGFFDPGFGAGAAYYVDGTWQAIRNYADNESGLQPDGGPIYTWPYIAWGSGGWRENLDGTYTLTPVELIMNAPAPNVLGALEGVYYVSGFANTVENIVNVGGVNHLVVQNIDRTGINNYCAIAMV